MLRFSRLLKVNALIWKRINWLLNTKLHWRFTSQYWIVWNWSSRLTMIVACQMDFASHGLWRSSIYICKNAWLRGACPKYPGTHLISANRHFYFFMVRVHSSELGWICLLMNLKFYELNQNCPEAVLKELGKILLDSTLLFCCTKSSKNLCFLSREWTCLDHAELLQRFPYQARKKKSFFLTFS